MYIKVTAFLTALCLWNKADFFNRTLKTIITEDAKRLFLEPEKNGHASKNGLVITAYFFSHSAFEI